VQIKSHWLRNFKGSDEAMSDMSGRHPTLSPYSLSPTPYTLGFSSCARHPTPYAHLSKA
jgi:hypothetical protein